MKKNRLLLLLALLMTAATGAWADEVTEIVFTEAITADNLAEDATFTADGSTFSATLADAGNKMVIDENACRFGTSTGYKSYSFRLKSGGASSSTKNFITLNIPEAGKLRIAVRTASNSATDRALVITQDETELYNAIVQESQAISVTENEQEVKVYPYVEVPVKAGSVRVSYSAGLNFYGFGFIASSGGSSASTYSVTLKDGVKDADKWTITPNEGLKEGDAVTLTYSGRLKVKGVKATSDAAPAKVPATVTTAPQATTGDIKAGSTTALVSGGVADGGTMMYAVTTENTKPTSTDGFSADVPTAKTLAAGTYYVWYYVKADDSHMDSEISATAVSVTVKPVVYPMAAEATAADYGKVVCAAGHLHDAKTAVPTGCTAVAVFAYMDGGNNRYGIALQNAATQANWNTITNNGANKNKLCNVPGTWTVTAPTDASWFVATKAIYEAMFINLGSTKVDDDGTTYDANVNAFITTGVGGTALNNYYWSTTEKNSTDAWCFSSTYWDFYGKSDQDWKVRPVLVW